jgi:hypothetical protein
MIKAHDAMIAGSNEVSSSAWWVLKKKLLDL